MKSFRVAVNGETFKLALHPWRLFFQENTQLLLEDLQHYSRSLLKLYNFRNVDECLRVPQNCLNNLIAFIGAYNPVEGYTTGGNKTGTSRFISIVLKDLSNNRIKRSLWDRYGDEAKSQLDGCVGKKFVVIILQLVRIVRWDVTSLATSYHVSKVIIDEHLPEIEEFRTGYLALLESASQSSSHVSRSSSESSLSGEVRTISQLRIAKNVKGFFFYGKIIRILLEDGWYYKGCPDCMCAKKVDAIGDEFVCNKCANKVTYPVARYRIKYEVDDGKSKTFVVFWGELSQRLFGKTVVDVVNEMDKAEGEQAPPKEIMEHVGRAYLFKSVGLFENDGGVRTYHISALDDNHEIVEMNKPKHCFSQSSENDSNDDLMMLSRTTTEVTSKESVQVDDEEVLTPSKRPVDIEDVGEDAASMSQGSTNKKMKGVKIEED